MSDDTGRRIRDAAIAALARREHSRVELERKLCAKGFDAPAVDAELTRLGCERLQDDGRFAESYIRHRVGRGYGPVKIRVELTQRGVDESLVSTLLEASGIDWHEQARAVWCKKFGSPAADFREHARQARFLQYRGFTSDQITSVLD